MTPFWERRRMIRESTLTAQEKLLLVWLADYAGDDGDAFPTLETLARDCSLSVRQCIRIVKSLAARGVLSITRGRSNRYDIDWTSPLLKHDTHVTSQNVEHDTGVTFQNGQTGHPCHLEHDTGVTLNMTPMSPKRTGTYRNIKTGTGGGFSEVTDDRLKDTRWLLDWLNARALSESRQPTENEQLNTIAAAERALECGDKPTALFVSIVKARRWTVINLEQEDRARQRLRSLRSPPPRANGAQGLQGIGAVVASMAGH